jgi:hydrogenase maturation protease
MTSPDGPILVLGIGNVLLRDDGAGVHVVRELGRLDARGDVEMPPGTVVLDGGTLGLDLLPLISDARAVLLVDAIDGGRAPGAVEAFRGEALDQDQAGNILPLPVGVGDVLGAARLLGVLPGAVTLVGIQPNEVAIGLELTEVVRAALPAAVATTLDELRRLDTIAPSSAPASIARGYAVRGSAT